MKGGEGGMYVGVEDLDESSTWVSNTGACDTFTDVPVSTPESRRTAVKGVSEH